jgi:methyl-accepting chemotaxis protein
MKWFYDLKIGIKLFISFMIIALLGCVIGFVGISEIKTIGESDASLYKRMTEPIARLVDLSTSVVNVRVAARDVLLAKTSEERNAALDRVNEEIKTVNAETEEYKAKITSEETRRKYNAFVDAKSEYLTKLAQFIDLAKQGKNDAAYTYMVTEMPASIKAQRAALNELVKLKKEKAKAMAETNTSIVESSVFTMGALMLIVFICAIIFGLFISRSIKNPVKKLLNMVQELQKGRLKTRANVDSKDEIGEMAGVLDSVMDQLEQFAGAMHNIAQGDVSITVPSYDDKDQFAPALNGITSTLRNLISEIKMLINGTTEGKLSIRGNADKFTGGYKEIVLGINDTLDAVIGPLNMAAEYVDRISKGNLPPKITEKYHGDFNEIKNNVNGCIDAIELLVSDINFLAEAAVAGNLSARADVSKHQGDFQKIVTGMNDTLNAVTEPLKLASSYMNNISKGVIPEKIEKDLKGDYNEIKESVNEMIKTLGMILKGVKRISVNISSGNLKDRGNSSILVGAWSGLVSDINAIIEPLVTNINFMGKNINSIAVGQIPDKISEEYQGDYNVIKNNLNICFDSIRTLIDDINDLSQGAIEGNLNTRADASKHQGDFKKIVEGVNNTLDAVTIPLNSAANYIEKIKNGEMSEPITEEFKGDFNGIKNNLNELIKTVAIIFRGVDRIANNMRTGNLNDRGNVNLFSGTWHRLITGINEIIIALVNPIRFMAGNINKISIGDIPEQITDEYQGEYNEVKMNLNTCFASIEALITDMTMLSDNAVEGRLTQRADASKHLGDYGKIIKGVNDTLDEILTPIKEGVIALEKMSSGDMTVRITSDYKGDHQLIKDSINGVAESLSHALNDVSEAISATASASNQISSSTEEMAAGSSEQTQQATEVAGAVEEMTRTILENTKNASHAAETAKKAGAKAVEGGHVVKETIDGMNKIAEVVKKSADTVQELGKSSDQIGEIVQVIDDIADQTNLLALNAAIEAARAGEQGRGFAVVADEVRKLAERTTKATKEIAVMIKQIQKDTGHAVESMGEGTKEVERGKALANKAGESLTEIVEESQRVVDIVTQVAAASEEQSTAAEEISKNIEGISSVTQQSAAGTQQIAHAAEDLNRLTLNLEKLIEQFNISGSKTTKMIS